MFRKFTVLALVCLIVFFTGCSSVSTVQSESSKATQTSASATQNDSQKTTPNITFVTPIIAHPVWNPSGEGFEQAMKDLGFDGNYVGPQNVDSTAQLDIMENALQNKAQGIATYVLSPVAFNPFFKRCDELGIPYVFVLSDAPGMKPLARVGTDAKELGRQAAKKVMEKFNGAPINAFIFMASMDAQFSIDGRDGYLEGFKDYEGQFTMVVNDATNSDTQKGMERLQNALLAHPEINCVISLCGMGGAITAKVIKELGLPKDKILNVAVDDTQETLDYMREGYIWATVAQDFYKMGYMSGKILYDKIVNGIDLGGKHVDTGSTFITLENIDTYKSK